MSVPRGLKPGRYVLSFRWDCEHTPQVSDDVDSGDDYVDNDDYVGHGDDFADNDDYDGHGDDADMFCWNCSQVCNEGCCHCVDSDNDDYEDGHNDYQTNCRFGVAAQIF